MISARFTESPIAQIFSSIRLLTVVPLNPYRTLTSIEEGLRDSIPNPVCSHNVLISFS
jgi:hypothetical protein